MLKELLKNKIFWLAISVLIIMISGILYGVFDIVVFGTVFLISLIYPLVLIVIMILFAWIINPLRTWIKRRKE